MKKAIALLLGLLVIPAALAAHSISVDEATVGVIQKDPTTWAEIPDAGHGEITLSYNLNGNGQIDYPRARVMVWNLQPKTEYTLMYYGDETNNDVWPFATCIKTFRTSLQGYAKSTVGRINYLPFIDDGINQKLWVVKASDVDCDLGVMTAWNPSEYLFEQNTI